VFKPAKSTEYSRETTLVYTQEYPLTQSMFGIGQMSRLNARCLPIGNIHKQLPQLYRGYPNIHQTI